MARKSYLWAFALFTGVALVAPQNFYAATDDSQVERILAVQQAEIGALKASIATLQSDLTTLWQRADSRSVMLCKSCTVNP